MTILRDPTLDVSVFRSRVDRTREALAALGPDLDETRLVHLLHEAIAAGLARPAMQAWTKWSSARGRAIPDLRGPLAWAMANVAWEAGERESVVRLARQPLPRGADVEIELLRVRVRAAWAGVLAGEEEPDLVDRLEELRERVAREQGPVSLVADLAHLDAYRDLVQSAAVDRALERAALAAELYRSIGESVHECKARVLLARIDAVGGRLQSAVENARRAAEQASRAGHPHLSALALNALATALFRRGEWNDAAAVYERGLEIAEAFGASRWALALRANRARLRALRGAVDEAEVDLLALVADLGDEQARPVRAILDEYRGQIRLLKGDARGALDHFERCERELERSGVASYERAEILLRRAEALLALEQPDQALVVCGEGLSRIEQSGQWLERGHLLRVRSRALSAMGRPTDAARDLHAAENALRRVGDRFELTRCLLDRAQRTEEPLERRCAAAMEALHLSRALGVPRLTDRARELQTILGASEMPPGDDEASRASASGPPRGLVAASSSTRALLAEAATAAASDAPVLLLGETGTGKEVLARFVHENSRRSQAPFVAINCAAIPENLFEREFFGHVRGAYTGADRDTPGLVHAADGGTLFLDEIGEMPGSLQPKLLRLLQEGTYRRVGETRQRDVDLRIVAATNRSLYEQALRGEFREDLYWRLSWFELGLKPLRERPEDVGELVKLFLAREGKRLRRCFWMEREAWRVVRAHDWPGNARQLESAVSSACARAAADGSARVRRADLPSALQTRSPRRERRGGSEVCDLQAALLRRERELILGALQRCDHRRSEAARLLGIGRATLYDKMRRLGIKLEPTERSA